MIVCDTYAKLKSKFLVNESELVKLGVKAFILFAEGTKVNDVVNLPKSQIPIYTWSQVMNQVGSDVGNGTIYKRIDN